MGEDCKQERGGLHVPPRGTSPRNPTPSPDGPPLSKSAPTSPVFIMHGARVASPSPTPASEISRRNFDLVFDRHRVNLDGFEEQLGAKLSLSAAVGKELRQAAGELRTACGGEESQLREHVKKWLNKIGEKRPFWSSSESAEKPAFAAILNEDDTNESESQFETVFDMYARRVKDAHAHALYELPKEPRGSLVTARSSQDLAFYVPTHNILFEGEVKNAPEYDKDSAIRQCTAYLYFQLWWFRTVQGKDVEAVYGFAVCGSGCAGRKDKDTVGVSLLILKMPQLNPPSIGGRYELYEFSEDHSVDNTAAFDRLGSFLLTQFKDPFQTDSIPDEYVFPGCMLMPPSWLRDGSEIETEHKKPTGWNIIKSGTGSLVIHCENKDVVLNLLQNHNDFLDGLQKEELKRVDGTGAWILKCRTLASGKSWDSTVEAIDKTRRLFDYLSKREDNLGHIATKWLDMYPVYSNLNRGRSIVLMKFIGDPFSAESLSYSKFKSEFSMLMDRTLTLEQEVHFVHGDIHEGNIRFDKNADVGWKLRLIDWDEASWYFPAARKTVTSDQKARYPQELRHLKNEVYTKNQLLCLFSSLNQKYRNDDAFQQWDGVKYEDYEDYPERNLLADEVERKFKALQQSLLIQGQG